jgi:hypothetical protein
MVNSTCALCCEQKRSNDMHHKTNIVFNEQEKRVFATATNEGKMCKQCYNVLHRLKHDDILVSILETDVCINIYYYYIIILLYYISL